MAPLLLPELVNVTLETASLFNKPLLVNSVPAKVSVVPKHLEVELAVMVKAATFTVKVPLV